MYQNTFWLFTLNYFFIVSHHFKPKGLCTYIRTVQITHNLNNARMSRVLCMSHTWHFIVVASHACKFDDQHAVTRTRNFCTCGNTYTQFLTRANTHTQRMDCLLYFNSTPLQMNLYISFLAICESWQPFRLGAF